MNPPANQPDGPDTRPAARADAVRACLDAVIAERHRAMRAGRPMSPGNARRTWERQWHTLVRTLGPVSELRRERLYQAMTRKLIDASKRPV